MKLCTLQLGRNIQLQCLKDKDKVVDVLARE